MDFLPWLCFSRLAGPEEPAAKGGEAEAAAAAAAGTPAGLEALALCLCGPFRELAGDLCWGEGLSGCAALLGGRGAREEPLLLQLGGAARGGWGRARALVLELLGDPGPGCRLALLAAAGPCTLAAGAHPALLACGLSLSNKAAYGIAGVVFGTAAWKMLTRLPQEADRSPMQRSALSLALSGATYLALAAGVTLPADLLPYVAHPDVMLRFLPEIIAMPLMVLNAGFIAGRPYEQIAPVLSFSFLSAVGFCAAAAVPDQSKALVLVGTGTLCMLKAAWDVEGFHHHALTFSAVNKVRAQIVGDALVFSWGGYPLVQGLGLVGALTEGSQMRLYVCLDVISKLTVSHFVLKNDEAFQNASQQIAEVRAAAAAPALEAAGPP